MDAARDRLDYVVWRDEAANLLVRGCTKRKIDKMPHTALRKFLVELNGLLVPAEGAFIMGSDNHLVSPGSNGNQIFIASLCKQFLHLCFGNRREKILGNRRDDCMSFLCPG